MAVRSSVTGMPSIEACERTDARVGAFRLLSHAPAPRLMPRWTSRSASNQRLKDREEEME